MQTIHLTDSLVITTSKKTHTISKVHPLFSRIEETLDDENKFYEVLGIEYTTIYQAYDKSGLLVVIRIADDGTKSVMYPTKLNEPQPDTFNPDKCNHLGTFITYQELIDYYPEYFL